MEQGEGPRSDEDGKIDGHLVKDYSTIFDIKLGEPGYVAPREDKEGE